MTTFKYSIGKLENGSTICPEDFKKFRFELGGWTQQQAAKALGVSLKTYQRYESGQNNNPPLAAYRLLAILAAGDLGIINPKWANWRIHDGNLYSPNNQTFNEGDLNANHLMKQLLDEIQRANGGVFPIPTEAQLTENKKSNVIVGHFPLSPNPWFGDTQVDEGLVS